MQLKTIALFIAVILGLYFLQIPSIIAFIDTAMNAWNRAAEYVFYFKDKEPFVFMCLPFLFVYVLAGDK